MENDINILLLGETGVGKSTFLNALINMLFYENLNHASKNDLKVLVYSKFILLNPQTFDDITIVSGTPNSNENHETGGSCTQTCRSYVFRFKDRQLRIIDTPGVGDIRGPDQERKNFENILCYISQFEHLNGIIFLLKPMETRLNIFFRFCIRELLRHLHVSAKDNIMFVFTHSRASLYRPGQTTRLLKILLKDILEQTNVEIPFNQDNTFMLDSESYRFLAALKNGIVLSEEQHSYESSWNMSATELSRLLKMILQCLPHKVRDTLSLNESVQLSRILSRPLAEISRLISVNITMAEDFKVKVKNSCLPMNLESLPQIEGKFVDIPMRLTVCTANSCTKIVNVDKLAVIDYCSICHEDCQLNHVVQECIGDPKLKFCWAMSGKGIFQQTTTYRGYIENQFICILDSCQKCACHWSQHMHITYLFENSPINITLDNSIDSASAINKIEQRIQKLRNEEKRIKEISRKISYFIRKKSLNPQNDDILDYLKLFVQEEEKKIAANVGSANLLLSLKRQIDEHESYMKTFEEDIADSSNDFSQSQHETTTIERLFEEVARLYRLPLYGASIRKQVDVIRQKRKQSAMLTEQSVDLSLECESRSPVLDEFRRMIEQEKDTNSFQNVSNGFDERFVWVSSTDSD